MSAAAPVLHIEGDRVTVPAAAFNLAGFRAWVTSPDFPESVRASFARGEVFLEMSPESIESHSKAKLEITVELGALVRDSDLGEVYPDGVLLTHEEAGISTEPDLAFVTWATLASGKLRLVPRATREDEYVEIQGAPDLVVEVVSDSSENKDLRVLREGYFRAEIPEYWIVDARGTAIKLTILKRGVDGYEPASPAEGAQRSAILGRTFELTRNRNRAGRWAYRLRTI